ncbi:hypothetical protein AYO21_09271 [Fonsecaea monophora]|uniref:Uncharacterized protein n=1 Tax=Fonsecaea monophora TaxID=254056 RepID=A0A177EZ55_9EURO|nr:hypothetical protein AYO21_09271 [Fonsecaea monophora]OAG36540.1 hypothetical protein AYO21_09271 [Fonsecaea monophora]
MPRMLQRLSMPADYRHVAGKQWNTPYGGFWNYIYSEASNWPWDWMYFTRLVNDIGNNRLMIKQPGTRPRIRHWPVALFGKFHRLLAIKETPTRSLLGRPISATLQPVTSIIRVNGQQSTAPATWLSHGPKQGRFLRPFDQTTKQTNLSGSKFYAASSGGFISQG